MKIEGILDHRFQIGGETQGWVLLPPDSIDEIELESGEVDINPFLGKYVEIEGDEEARWGVERGDYLVVVVRTIKEIDD